MLLQLRDICRLVIVDILDAYPWIVDDVASIPTPIFPVLPVTARVLHSKTLSYEICQIVIYQEFIYW